MSDCAFEGKVLAGQELEHARTCASCREALLLQARLREEAGRLAGRAQIASAGAVVWRGQLRMKRKKAEEACMPVHLVEGFGFLAAVLYLAWTAEGEWAGVWRAVVSVVVLLVFAWWLLSQRGYGWPRRVAKAR